MTTAASTADRARASQPTVLVLGGTGRTGRLVVQELLARGARVRAIVRSAERLPSACAAHSNLEVEEAEILAMNQAKLKQSMDGCDAVVSCLGHPNDARGVFGPPFDLVTPVTERLHAAALAQGAAEPLRFVLMSSVSVNDPSGRDSRRGLAEGAMLALLRALVPPARDNQRAADFLCREVGPSCAALEWVAVRPDSLLDGDLAPSTPDYTLNRTPITSLFRPARTHRANVARFMCDLVCDAQVWRQWKGELPVVVDAAAAPRRERRAAASQTPPARRAA